MTTIFLLLCFTWQVHDTKGSHVESTCPSNRVINNGTVTFYLTKYTDISWDYTDRDGVTHQIDFVLNPRPAGLEACLYEGIHFIDECSVHNKLINGFNRQHPMGHGITGARRRKSPGHLKE